MTYMVLNKYNLVDQLHLATQFAEEEVIYKDDNDEFNEVNILYSEEKDKYSLEINGMNFGNYDDKGTVIETVLLSLGSA